MKMSTHNPNYVDKLYYLCAGEKRDITCRVTISFIHQEIGKCKVLKRICVCGCGWEFPILSLPKRRGFQAWIDFLSSNLLHLYGSFEQSILFNDISICFDVVIRVDLHSPLWVALWIWNQNVGRDPTSDLINCRSSLIIIIYLLCVCTVTSMRIRSY